MADTNITIQVALMWLGLGVPVVPGPIGEKVVNLRWSKWFDRLPDASSLRMILKTPHNIAVITGCNGLVVIDVDEGGDDSRRQVVKRLGTTYTEITPRGYHLYYFTDPAPEGTRYVKGIGEIMGKYHLCLVYPSIHPSGQMYRPMDDTPIRKVDPDAIFSLLSKKSPAENNPISRTINRPYVTPDAGTPVQRAKMMLRVEDLAGDYVHGLVWSYDHRYLRGYCPFHDDQVRSFWVDVDRQWWGCFATGCKAHRGGDVINLYSMIHGCTIKDAIRDILIGKK